MTSALLAYQSGLLLRSQRWLAPVVLYAAVLAIGLQNGQPILDSLGYAAAGLLPAGAWLARICVSNEPPAARSCTAAATGPWRAHCASLLTALLATALLGALAALVVALAADGVSTDHRVPVPVLPAAGAGLLAAWTCALVGTAVGAVTTWPVVRSTGAGVAGLLLGTVLTLVAPGSPARSAITAMITGSQDGVVRLPALPFLGAVVLAVAGVGAACGLAARR
jgi:hypothetical protein